MEAGGKRPAARQEVIFAAAGPDSSLPTVSCQLTGTNFLLDSGAAVSVLPAKQRSESSASLNLCNADGTTITTYGSKDITIKLCGQSHTHRFVLADIHRPILGADFLRLHNFNIYFAGKKEIKAASATNCPGCSGPQRRPAGASLATVYPSTRPQPALHSVPTPKLSTVNHNEFSVNHIQVKVTKLLEEFKDITSEVFSHQEPSHGVQHKILTDCLPVHAKPRRLDPQRLAAAKAKFLRMEE